MKVAIVGASSTIAEAAAARWVGLGAELVLIGRNQHSLDIVKNHLQIKTPGSKIETLAADFAAADNFAAALAAIKDIDVALIAHGELTEQSLAQRNAGALAHSVYVNAASAAIALEAFASRFEEQKHGTLAVIGSVAGDRGRTSNYAYGAAKGFIERFAQGLQMRFSGSNVAVVLFKVGPTKTRMTAGMDQKGFASADSVAEQIVRVISKQKSASVYVPGKWRLIMLVIKTLPTAVLAKLNL